MATGKLIKDNRSDRTPTALLPYQQAWMEDDSQVKIHEKSRRIGLSWCEAADSTLHAASQNGSDVFYIGYNKDMAQEFIEDCADWAKHYSQAADAVEEFVFKDSADKEILAFKIRFASGYKIVALSSRPSNLRGKQGKVVIDEAAFHDDLPELIKAAMALLIWGGKVVIISTHNGDENPFNEIIKEVRAGKKPYNLHRVTFDDALYQGLYKRICLRLNNEWSQAEEYLWRQSVIDFYGKENADEELFCIPSKGSGTFLPTALIESCQDADIPILKYTCKASFVDEPEHIRVSETEAWCRENLDPYLEKLHQFKPTYIGQDFGRSGDLSVQWPIQEQAGLKHKPPFIIELRNVPFEQQRQIFFYLCDHLPRFRGGALDARGNGQYLAEVSRQRYGANRIFEVMLSESWYRENMPRFKQAFEDNETFVPKDGDVMDDHRAIKMIKGVAKVPDTVRAKGRDGGQRHGDSAIAHVLSLYAARELAGCDVVEYETVTSGRFSKKGAW
ncbi:MAG: hypothetical protein GY696_08800 [Gammaproteobacteria bacterium]|nr:hypothetical protein [Gammaproteobacteria bacterium]